MEINILFVKQLLKRTKRKVNDIGTEGKDCSWKFPDSIVPRKNEVFTQCCFNVGSPSSTLAQH